MGLAPWFAIAVGTFAALMRLGSANRRFAWQRSRTLHGANRLDVTADGVRIANAHSDQFFRWSYFTRYAETPNLFLLHGTDENRRLIIPKRLFAQELSALRALISIGIAEGTFLPARPPPLPMSPQRVLAAPSSDSA